jgi:hypothetical protein
MSVGIKIKSHPSRPAGLRGATGPQGPQGATGPQGPASQVPAFVTGHYSSFNSGPPLSHNSRIVTTIAPGSSNSGWYMINGQVFAPGHEHAQVRCSVGIRSSGGAIVSRTLPEVGYTGYSSTVNILGAVYAGSRSTIVEICTNPSPSASIPRIDGYRLTVFRVSTVNGLGAGPAHRPKTHFTIPSNRRQAAPAGSLGADRCGTRRGTRRALASARRG